MSEDRTLILSLRPRFAEAFIAGTKTVEVRRRPIRATAGTRVILYASSPTMAVVGTAKLVDSMTLKPRTAWRRYRDTLSLSWAEFSAYLEGVENAHLLRLDDVKQLGPPVHLYALRQAGSFTVPQSFRYVSPTDPVIHRLAERR